MAPSEVRPGTIRAAIVSYFKPRRRAQVSLAQIVFGTGGRYGPTSAEVVRMTTEGILERPKRGIYRWKGGANA